MFKLSRIACAACAWAVIAMPAAMAADIAPPVYEPVPVPPAVGGWYLRGDIGYKIYGEPDADWDDSIAGVDFDDTDLDDTGVVGVGFGYKFNNWLRADVTLDYEWPSDFEGTSPCPAPCNGGPAGVNVEVGELSAITTLANVYLDLGNYGGFSPYVGAGIGAAFLMMDDIESHNADGSTIDWGDGDDWNFAWALMAGMAYSFTPNMAVDVGYRYLNLGEVSSDTIDFGAGDGDFTYDNIDAHEIRVGLRYTIF
jgi:opacity protein-like surface antigen